MKLHYLCKKICRRQWMWQDVWTQTDATFPSLPLYNITATSAREIKTQICHSEFFSNLCDYYTVIEQARMFFTVLLFMFLHIFTSQ
jgi:hypothetical protein